MYTLYHYPLCPFSRTIRLVLGIYGLKYHLIEENTWEHRKEFLEMNPAGTLPVLVVPDQKLYIPGVGTIAAYLEETGACQGRPCLMPEDPVARIEVRRLMDWFHIKFNNEVTHYLLVEKVFRRFIPKNRGGGSPDAPTVRVAVNNAKTHMRYIGHLIRARKWLAGDELSHADLAAAAHLSCLDYLNHVPWSEDKDAKLWYARIKSQPVFRAFLTDRILGMPPPASYSDLDF